MINIKILSCVGQLKVRHIPLFGDDLVLPLPPGLEVGTELKPKHEEVATGHLLLLHLGL